MPKPTKLVYVAGPFRGPNAWETEQNIRRAEELALKVWRAGYACFCPHSNTRFFDGVAPNEVWLEGDLVILRRCDALLMTQDFERSTGAKVERDEAVRLNIPVYYSLRELLCACPPDTEVCSIINAL